MGLKSWILFLMLFWWISFVQKTGVRKNKNLKKNQKSIHLIFTQDVENKLMERLSEDTYIKTDKRKTKRQILEENFETGSAGYKVRAKRILKYIYKQNDEL